MGMKWMQHWRREAGEQLDSVLIKVWLFDQKCFDTITTSPRLQRLNKLFVLATYIGDGYLWATVAMVLIVFGSPTDLRYVGVMAIISCFNIVIFRMFKRMTKRGRPGLEPLTSDRKFRLLDSYSFPSGHATTSFGMAYMLFHFYPTPLVFLTFYPLAILIGFSRIYLGEHYPADVMGGALLGTLIASLLLPILT